MYATKWMNLINSILNERSQSQKTTFYTTPLLWNTQKRKIYRDRKQISGCWGLGRGGKVGLVGRWQLKHTWFNLWWWKCLLSCYKPSTVFQILTKLTLTVFACFSMFLWSYLLCQLNEVTLSFTFKILRWEELSK